MTRIDATADLGGRFRRLTFVNILSNVTVPFAGLVDTAMLGHLDEIRFLAGVALASVLFDYVYWAVYFLRMGTTGTTAQAVGRGDRPEVWNTLYRSMILALIIGGAMLLFQWPLREAGFGLLSGEASVEAAGRAYFDARIWGAPATLANFVLLGWFLGREQARSALAMTVVGNLANIALNWVFIVRLQLAAYGAGLATMASQYLMLALAIWLVLRQPDRSPPCRRGIVEGGGFSALVRLNRNILIRSLMLVSAFAIFVNVSSTMGTIALAANSILIRVQNLAAYLIDGAAFASESLAGVLVGARQPAALRRLVRMSLSWGVLFAVGVLVLFLGTARPFFQLMTSHIEVIELGLRYAPWMIPILLFGALAFQYDGIFLGLTEARRLRNAMLISTLCFFVPPAWLAWHLGDNRLLWFAMALFMAARAGTLALALRGVFRELESS